MAVRELAMNGVEVKVHSQRGEYAVQPVASSSTLSPKRSTPSSALPYNNPHHQQYVLSDDFRPFKWVCHGWFRYLWELISFYSLFQCMSMIAPRTRNLVLASFLGDSRSNPSRKIPFLFLPLPRECLFSCLLFHVFIWKLLDALKILSCGIWILWIWISEFHFMFS